MGVQRGFGRPVARKTPYVLLEIKSLQERRIRKGSGVGLNTTYFLFQTILFFKIYFPDVRCFPFQILKYWLVLHNSFPCSPKEKDKQNISKVFTDRIDLAYKKEIKLSLLTFQLTDCFHVFVKLDRFYNFPGSIEFFGHDCLCIMHVF